MILKIQIYSDIYDTLNCFNTFARINYVFLQTTDTHNANFYSGDCDDIYVVTSCGSDLVRFRHQTTWLDLGEDHV